MEQKQIDRGGRLVYSPPAYLSYCLRQSPEKKKQAITARFFEIALLFSAAGSRCFISACY